MVEIFWPSFKSMLFAVFMQPLPFSEEHDVHVDCVLGVAPDLMVFIDSSTKVHAVCTLYKNHCMFVKLV